MGRLLRFVEVYFGGRWNVRLACTREMRKSLSLKIYFLFNFRFILIQGLFMRLWFFFKYPIIALVPLDKGTNEPNL